MALFASPSFMAETATPSISLSPHMNNRSDSISTASSDPTLASPTSVRNKASSFLSSSKPATAFMMKHGRRYHGDQSLPYILPCDIQELNRQNLKHLLFNEVFGGLFMAEFSDEKIPSKVLDIGCGSGIWIASVADAFTARGRPDVKFFGMDIVEMTPELPGVDFTFVKHNALKSPFPFEDGEFDYIFIRDMSLCIPNTAAHSEFVTECLRCLKGGGAYEVQCTDHAVRILLEPSVPRNTKSSGYKITPTIQFSASKNPFIQSWNDRLTPTLTKRALSAVPCTLIGPTLLQEEELVNFQQIRIALPLDEVWWESPTFQEADGSRDSRGISRLAETELRRKNSLGAKSAMKGSPLSDSEKAVRHLARTTFAQMIESLEPYLREANGIPQDDWDRWFKELMSNFCRDGGLKNGECLEFGAWWGIKKQF